MALEATNGAHRARGPSHSLMLGSNVVLPPKTGARKRPERYLFALLRVATTYADHPVLPRLVLAGQDLHPLEVLLAEETTLEAQQPGSHRGSPGPSRALTLLVDGEHREDVLLQRGPEPLDLDLELERPRRSPPR